LSVTKLVNPKRMMGIVQGSKVIPGGVRIQILAVNRKIFSLDEVNPLPVMRALRATVRMARILHHPIPRTPI